MTEAADRTTERAAAIAGFDAAAAVPEAWLDLARVHKRVVDLLWPGDFTQRPLGNLLVAMHHAGMAIENLMKGILIAKGLVVVSGGELPRSFTTHDLRGLAARAGIPMDGEGEDLLFRLRRFIEWAGRYPLPKIWDRGVTGIGPDDKERIDRLFDRLADALRSAAQEGRGSSTP